MCGAGTEASDDQSLETPGDLGQPRRWDPNQMSIWSHHLGIMVGWILV